MGAAVNDSFTADGGVTLDDGEPSTVNFAVLYNTLREETTANVSEESIPFGDYTVVQRGGGGPEHGEVGVYLSGRTEKDELKRKARKGEVGTLHYIQGDFTVVLKSFRVTAYYDASDEWEGTLSYTADVS